MHPSELDASLGLNWLCAKERYRYDDVKNLYAEQLAFIWMGDSTKGTTRASVKEKIQNFARGDLDHATEMLSAFWAIANNDEGVVTSARVLPIVSSFMILVGFRVLYWGTYTGRYQCAGKTCPQRLKPVFVALSNSIRSGIFFDRKYWARHSKAGDSKPVYLSSIVMGDKAQQLKKCELKLISGMARR